ncbi:MAG: class I SAM-dependent methyltransferase [Candidatus Bathyarchaeia archaeon]
MVQSYDGIIEEKNAWDDRARTIQDDIELRGTLKNPIKQVNKSRKAIYKIFRKSQKRRLLLDIGCGNGLFTVPLTELFDFVVGVDLSKAMMKRCREKRENLNFILASATDLPLKSGVFDAVISLSVLEYIKPKSNIEKTLKEISRVTTNNSAIFLTFWDAPNSPTKLIKNLLKKEGFKLKQSLISKFQFTRLNFTKYVKLYGYRS